jgi:uncharacterized protein (DUF488 family)
MKFPRLSIALRNPDIIPLIHPKIPFWNNISRKIFVTIMPKLNSIWTIGHSTHPFEEFVAMLHSFKIEMVADIRNFPGSRKFPYFNKEALEISLPENKISYVHLKALGGRRKAKPDSKNTAWRHPAFRGYADYMETDEFKNGIHALEKVAMQQRTAYMCSEAVWWRCHRSMVSDYLKRKAGM